MKDKAPHCRRRHGCLHQGRTQRAVRRDGRRRGTPGAGRCRPGLQAGAAGLRRLRHRRHHIGAASALLARPHRHSDRQCQQRLRHRIDGALPCAPGGAKRHGGCGAGGRFRADAGRRAGLAVQRPPRRQRHAQRDDPAATRAGTRRHRSRRSTSVAPAASTSRNTACATRPSPRSRSSRAAMRRRTLWQCSASRPRSRKCSASPHIFGTLTRLQCCPPTCGAAAAVVVSAEFARSRGLARSVAIAGQALTTDTGTSFDDGSMIAGVGFDMTRRAAQQAYARGRRRRRRARRDRAARLLHAERDHQLRGARPLPRWRRREVHRGRRQQLRRQGGDQPVGRPACQRAIRSARPASRRRPRSSGTCAATAGERQVEGARLGLQHNVGLGGACVVTVFER